MKRKIVENLFPFDEINLETYFWKCNLLVKKNLYRDLYISSYYRLQYNYISLFLKTPLLKKVSPVNFFIRLKKFKLQFLRFLYIHTYGHAAPLYRFSVIFREVLFLDISSSIFLQFISLFLLYLIFLFFLSLFLACRFFLLLAKVIKYIYIYIFESFSQTYIIIHALKIYSTIASGFVVERSSKEIFTKSIHNKWKFSGGKNKS